MVGSSLKRGTAQALLMLAVSAQLGLASEPSLPQHDESLTPLSEVDPNAYRVLFIGNSITRHGIAEHLGWGHVSGMAASKEASDYVHVFADSLRTVLAPQEVAIYNHVGGQGSIRGRLSTLDEVLDVRPHLVVLQLGEHEKPEMGIANIRKDYAALVGTFRKQQPSAKLICVGPWGGLNVDPERVILANYQYSGFKGMLQAEMRDVCESSGAPFVSVADLTLDQKNYGFGQTWGVRWHPNDRGHAAYARRILEAFLATSREPE